MTTQNEYNKLREASLPVVKSLAHTEAVRLLPLKTGGRMNPRTIRGQKTQRLFLNNRVGVYEIGYESQPRYLFVGLGSSPAREQNGKIRHTMTPILSEQFRSVEEIISTLMLLYKSGIPGQLHDRGIAQLPPSDLAKIARDGIHQYRDKAFKGSTVVSVNDLHDAMCFWNSVNYIYGAQHAQRILEE